MTRSMAGCGPAAFTATAFAALALLMPSAASSAPSFALTRQVDLGTLCSTGTVGVSASAG